MKDKGRGEIGGGTGFWKRGVDRDGEKGKEEEVWEAMDGRTLKENRAGRIGQSE